MVNKKNPIIVSVFVRRFFSIPLVFFFFYILLCINLTYPNVPQHYSRDYDMNKLKSTRKCFHTSLDFIGNLLFKKNYKKKILDYKDFLYKLLCKHR